MKSAFCILPTLAIITVLALAVLAESQSNNRAFGEPAKPITSSKS